ncbi:MAG: GtrA family protein [Propionibacteriaceae bacterium]|nr:GtrA family protein [Propionibacteriaceae bacterium]
MTKRQEQATLVSGRWGRLFTQFVKFAIVGASGVVVNMLVAFIMNKAHGGAAFAREAVWTWPGSDVALRYSYVVYVVAFLVANASNYQLNRSWTFRGHPVTWWRGFFAFMGAGVIGAAVGFVVKVLLTHPGSGLYLSGGFFTDSGWHAREYWGQLIGILIGTPVNFIVNRIWAFRSHTRAAVAPAPGVDEAE